MYRQIFCWQFSRVDAEKHCVKVVVVCAGGGDRDSHGTKGWMAARPRENCWKHMCNSALACSCYLTGRITTGSREKRARRRGKKRHASSVTCTEHNRPMAALRTQMPSLASRPHITSHASVDIGRRTASSFSVAEPKTVVNAIRFRRPDGGCPDKASFKSSRGGSDGRMKITPRMQLMMNGP